jgi:hypothetical protein
VAIRISIEDLVQSIRHHRRLPWATSFACKSSGARRLAEPPAIEKVDVLAAKLPK